MAGRRNTPPQPTAPNTPRNVDNVDTVDADWLVVYPALYESESRRARQQRREDRDVARERRKARPAQPLTPDQAVFRDWAVDRAASRAAAVDARWRCGHVWIGGYVGGNRAYYKAAQIYQGLVSDEHAVLQLFVAKLPKAANLMTGATKAQVGRGDSKLLALDEAYVAANSQMRGILRVEVDAVFPGGFAEVESLCHAAGVPLPNVVVGYVDRRGALWRPHLLWVLDKSVTFCGKGRSPNRALWHRVLRGLTHALVPGGADPGGLSNPMRVKNPLCPVWDRAILADRPYSLADIKPHVRPDVTEQDLADAVADRAADHVTAAEPIPDPLAGSNALFAALRDWARDHVVARQAAGAEIEEWRAEMVIHALALATRCGCTEERARATALRVADYTWTRPPRQPLPAEEVARRRRDAAHGTHEMRRDKTGEAVVAAYLDFLDRYGAAPTQQEVAAVIGKTRKTVGGYWPAAREAAEQRMGNMLPSVKKGAGADAQADGTALSAPGHHHLLPGLPTRQYPAPPAFLTVNFSRRPPAPAFFQRPLVRAA